MTDPSRIAVILASAGRPELLAEVISDLSTQTVPFKLVVSVPDVESLPAGGLPDDTLLAHAHGAAAQRNAGLALVPEHEFIFFFDDDSVVREDYLEVGVAFMGRHPGVVGLTGRVLLDGASGAEVTRDEALAAIEASSRQPVRQRWKPSRELYGCNFAFRVSGSGGERLDARLPLYSWLEDHDFARRLMRHGALAVVEDCVIVHRGVKSGGRTAHKRLGYSQMMNPLYLHHVGSFPAWLAFHEIVFRCGKNLVFSAAGPERVWRRERLMGNLAALGDALRRRFTPERMLDF